MTAQEHRSLQPIPWTIERNQHHNQLLIKDAEGRLVMSVAELSLAERIVEDVNKYEKKLNVPQA